MAMGREFQPPEDADSWGEFHARLESEQASADIPLTPRSWFAGAALFAIMLLTCAYAFRDGGWWRWLIWLAVIGALIVVATRAVERADRRRARAVELGRLYDAWVEHVERHSPTL